MDPHGPCARRATPPGRYLRDRGVDHLPCAKGHSAIADGKGEIGTKKAGLVGREVLFKEQKISSYRHLGMSRHVVRAFTGVLERNLLWDKPVQKNVFVQMLQRIKFAQLWWENSNSPADLGAGCRL